MMKKLLTFLLTALLAFSVGWAEEATFTVSTYNTGTLAGAPSGVSAEVSTDASQMGNGGSQLTSGKYYTLTLKDFSSSYKLTGIKLNYCTNSSKGTGSFTAKLGSTELGSYSITKVSSNGTTPRDAVLNITETVFNGNDLVLSVNATANSVYVIKFTITYEANGGPTPVDPVIYKKVTSSLDLVAGKKYAILYENGSSSVGMGELDANRYGTPVTGLSLEDNKVDIAGTGVMTMTLGGESNAWTLYMDNSEKYLSYSTGHAFFVAQSPQASATDITKWTITPSASATAIHSNKNTDTYIRYSSQNTSPVFQCNTVNYQSPVALYVEYAGQVGEISFSPAAGTYAGTQSVTISCDATSDATIYYTTDGSTPTTSSTVYTGPIQVTEDMTIKAIAVAPAMDSSSAEAAYAITAPPVTTVYEKITSTEGLTGGNYLIVYEGGSVAFDGSRTTLDAVSNTKSVTISNDQIETAEEIFFTYDANAKTLKSASGYYIGRTADSNGLDANQSTAYTNTISFDNDGNANIVGSGGAYLRYNKDSGSTRFRYYKSSTYTAQQAVQLYKEVTPTTPKVATPTFSPDPSVIYTSAQEVTISCATEGAMIHYTYNGGSEQTGTSPITLNVNSTATIVAWATLTDYDDSDVATATYTINLTPTMTVAPTELTFGTLAGDQLTVTTSNLTAGVNATVLNTDYSTNTDKWTVTPSTLGTDGGSMTVNYGGRLLKSDNTVRVSSNGVADVDVPVHYKHSAPIYIVTNANNWDFNSGTEMTRNGDTYSYTLNATADTYLVFTKKVGDDVNWNTNYLFGPVSSGDWWLTEESVDTDFALDSTAYHVVKMHHGTYTITLNAATNVMRIVADVHAPVFSLAEGRYYEAQTLEMTCDTEGAHIYYTTDGSTPSATNGTLYTGPVTISESTTLKAVAIFGNITSPVTTATYTIKPMGSDEFTLVTSTDDITADDEYVLVYTSTAGDDYALGGYNSSYYNAINAGFVLADDVVTLEDPTDVNVLTLIDAGNNQFYIKDEDGDYLYYSGSGNSISRKEQNGETNAYKWNISINSNEDAVIQNVGYESRYLECNVGSGGRYACYQSTLPEAKLYKRGSTVKVQAPVITPAGGTSNKFYESVDVEITCATENVTIYYTLDGSTPTASSDEYDPAEGLTVPYGSAPTTVKAIAVDGEGNVSKVTTVVYYWDRVKVAITPESQQVISNVEVTITPTPSDATVTYQVNGGAAQTYTGPFTVTVTEENPEVTVVATATKGESTATATATYTLKDGGVNSIAEFNALSTDEEVFFKNPVTVLFEYSQNTDATQDYIWVKDRTGYAQLFITPAFDNTNFKPKYENGDVIPAGFTVVKNYYSNGGYFQGFCNGENRSTFKDATEKALADPEQVTLTQLLNSIPTESGKYSEYNNRYLYINKLKVSDISGLGFSIATDENGDGTAEVSGGSAVVGYNKYHDWKNKQGQTVGVTLPTDGEYYNVTFIFQKWQGGYEIMPIEFTPWEENKVRLEDLVKIEVSTPYKEYTISNDLIATKVTWDDNKGKFAIFAKDDEAYASPRHRLDGQESYFIRYENVNHPELNNTVMQEDYDQSNWVEILIPSAISAINSKLDGGYQSQLDEFKSQFENKILPGGSIRGTYIDKLNPTIEYNLSELPSNLAKSVYKPNIYTPVNFLMENLDDEGSEAGAKSYRTDALGNQYFFMMDGKPQEMGLVVWCYYPGNGDYFYIPARVGDQVNGHQFRGSFKADMSLCEDPDVSTANGGGAIVNCFAPSNADGNGIDQVKLYGFNAIVRKNPAYNSGSSNGAPRRVDVAPYYEGTETNPAYIVYPLNAGAKSTGTVTSVAELASSRVVESVRYYNIMGMESEQPFEGINIVVTRYSDGSSSTAKVLR